MANTRWKARTKRDLIIEVWEHLDCETVGAVELEEIQKVVREKLGPGADESPASIARVLADEGAILRYPEVLDCDTRWRERRAFGPFQQEEFNFSSLAAASESFKKLDVLRKGFRHEGNELGMQGLRDLVAYFKGEAALMARSRILEKGARSQAREIARWLSIWLQEPDIFEDWRILRERSPEFRKMFKT